MTGVLFGRPDDEAADRAYPRVPGRATVLITVSKPQLSRKGWYRETLCVAGLRAELFAGHDGPR